MMFLGQECNHPACYLHDFLPFNVGIFWMDNKAVTLTNRSVRRVILLFANHTFFHLNIHVRRLSQLP